MDGDVNLQLHVINCNLHAYIAMNTIKFHKK